MLILKKVSALSLLVILSSVLFFSGLAKSSLWDIDEPNNAECAREMMVRHDPIVPTFNWELRTDKPALVYWCMWAGYKLFGVNEFGARFASPLFGVATIILVFCAANALMGWPGGWWAGLILMTTLFFNISVRIATPDAALIFFINLAIFSFLLGYEKKSSLYFYLFYIAMAAAVLAKGPMGIVLPLATIFVFLLIKRDFSILRQARVVQGIVIFLLIALPWYILVGIKTHGAFLFSNQGFLIKHNLHRFLRPMEGHQGPIFFYLLVLPFAFFPWGGLLPYILWAGHKSRISRKISNTEIFLWLWIAIFITFFSLARTKLPTYINPIYPALAILTAFYIQRCPQWAQNLLLCFNAFLGLVLMIGGGAVLAYFYPHLVWIAFLGFFPILGWQVGLYLKKRSPRWVLVSQGFMAYFFIITTTLWVVPAIDQLKITKPFALDIKSKMTPKATIVAYKYFQPSLVFYTQHKIIKAGRPSEIERVGQRSPLVFIIGPQRALLKLTTVPVKILDCRPGFYVRKKICIGKIGK